MDTAPASVAETKPYLAAFDESLASSRSAEDLQSRLKTKYPDLVLDVILSIGAQAAFKVGAK